MRQSHAISHLVFDVFPSSSRAFAFFNVSRNCLLARTAYLAGTSKSRRKGLLGVSTFEEGRGLWIVPCEAIHTFGMKLPIDSVFLGEDLQVRDVRSGLKPRRIAFCLRAHSVLELPAGTIIRSGTQIGDILQIQ